MNQLPLHRRVQILSALVEGSSLRSTSRMARVSINTVTKLLIDAGEACARYQHDVMRNLTCKRLQLDEIWSFCYAKEKNVPDELRGQPGYGDVWTFVAIDAETKIVPSWLVGLRDGCFATTFVQDLASRLTHRVQITTDGHRMYLDAMEEGFGGEVDFAQLIKHYGSAGQPENPETRYSPGECCGTTKNIVTGAPEREHISTSYIERQNLTMRMRMRRFTRLTNAFSKKLENHEHAVALHFFHYNFIRRHQTLRMPPALKAHVTDHLWTLEELAELIDRHTRNPERNSN
jgi:IS1 family transposase/lambda repressor-like predicted transcriptional regulator